MLAATHHIDSTALRFCLVDIESYDFVSVAGEIRKIKLVERNSDIRANERTCYKVICC